MPLVEYTDIVNDTLEDLADHFDHLADEGFFDEDYDCTLAVSSIHNNIPHCVLKALGLRPFKSSG